MAKRVEKSTLQVNGVAIEQRLTDGFINATAMCKAYGKKLSTWFRTQDTLELFIVLAEDSGVLSQKFKDAEIHLSDIKELTATNYALWFPKLILTRKGSPENGGGTWLHPDLAIQLAQWCDARFAILVSRWVRKWMTSAYNPAQIEVDIDRVTMRDELKNTKRLALTGQVKAFLERAGTYFPSSPNTASVFASVHDEINVLLTGERARAMKVRLEQKLGKKVGEQELIRDYFPICDLANYAAICQAAANNMENEPQIHPVNAVKLAAKQVLPSGYQPRPIDFDERIDLVRKRRITQSSNPLLAS